MILQVTIFLTYIKHKNIIQCIESFTKRLKNYLTGEYGFDQQRLLWYVFSPVGYGV